MNLVEEYFQRVRNLKDKGKYLDWEHLLEAAMLQAVASIATSLEKLAEDVD